MQAQRAARVCEPDPAGRRRAGQRGRAPPGRRPPPPPGGMGGTRAGTPMPDAADGRQAATTARQGALPVNSV